MPDFVFCKDVLLSCLSNSIEAYKIERELKYDKCENAMKSTRANSDILNVVVEHCKAIGN